MKYTFLFDYIHKWFDFTEWYQRKDYLDTIKLSLWSNVIKILSGLRRVGKSYILKQLIQELLKEWDVSLSSIFYLHLEDDRIFNIGLDELREIWESYYEHYYQWWVIYAFFDEIQNIHWREKFIRNLQEQFAEKIQIFITWSNSNLLSSELSTILTGRYIEYTVYPFSFSDFLHIKQIDVSEFDPKKYEYFDEYLKYWWLPEVIKIQDHEIKQNYLKTLSESIIFKDIVQRYQIKKTQLLESLLVFVYKTTCSNLSINSIVKYLKQEFPTLDYETINSYLNYIDNTFLINKVSSINDKTKHILKGKNKFYSIDTGIRNAFSYNYDREKILETFVFIELRRRGYQVQNIEWDGFEIDFIAQKGEATLLIQVAYTLYEESTLAREIGALQKTWLHYPKIILTMDKEEKEIDGIKIMHITDFLERI